jgi:hypothetical protein
VGERWCVLLLIRQPCQHGATKCTRPPPRLKSGLPTAGAALPPRFLVAHAQITKSENLAARATVAKNSNEPAPSILFHLPKTNPCYSRSPAGSGGHNEGAVDPPESTLIAAAARRPVSCARWQPSAGAIRPNTSM